ncbi:MAG: hypothetical protein FJX72_19440 [Armatimonadetes bacterium]|nr:hypothetical protein [Armatimonadota bacterium]
MARVSLGMPTAEATDLLSVEIRAGGAHMIHESGLLTRQAPVLVAAMPDGHAGGVGMRGEPDKPGFRETGAHVNWDTGECDRVAKRCLKMHPPWLGGAIGRTYAVFDPVKLPADTPAAFRAIVGKLDGSDPGDGILYEVYVLDEAGAETVAGSHTVRLHRWEPFEVDLTPWAGRTVRLKLVLDPGPADDSSGDWGCWADLRIETLNPEWTRQLDARSDLYRRRPAPYPIEGLTRDDIRTAKRGWLRFDGKGLNAGGHECFGVLNGVEIGPLPAAGGDEVAGKYAERVGLALKPDAIATLGRRNRLAVKNPNQDYFSIRRFWIELELADGRRCSSDIADVTFSQPPAWPHAEGILVPFGVEIEVAIWFGPMAAR